MQRAISKLGPTWNEAVPMGELDRFSHNAPNGYLFALILGAQGPPSPLFLLSLHQIIKPSLLF